MTAPYFPAANNRCRGRCDFGRLGVETVNDVLFPCRELLCQRPVGRNPGGPPRPPKPLTVAVMRLHPALRPAQANAYTQTAVKYTLDLFISASILRCSIVLTSMAVRHATREVICQGKPLHCYRVKEDARTLFDDDNLLLPGQSAVFAFADQPHVHAA